VTRERVRYVAIALNHLGSVERSVLNGDATPESVLADVGFLEVTSAQHGVKSSLENGSRRGD
jgi:hypothetical protein